MPSSTRPKFIWGSGDLLIVNPTLSIEQYLSYWHKSLEFDFRTRQKQTKREKILLYTVLCESPRIIKTFQGFLDDLLKLTPDHDYEDRRTWFPEPDYSKIKGFRLNQEQLFRELHKYNRSGILEAPCRYGKSIMIANTLRIFPGLKSVVAAPGVDLLNQTVKDLQAQLPKREVVGIFTGAKGKKKQSEDVTVTSLDSLTKIDKEGTKLVLVDEPHSSVSASRAPELASFKNARLYGFGASTKGRYDGSDALIKGIIGPVLAKRTFKEAVAEGAVCPIVVWGVKVQFDAFNCWSRDKAYDLLLYHNSGFNALVKEISDNIIPGAFQTLIFCDEKKQIDLMNLFVTSGVPAIAQRLKPDERRAVFADMVSGKTKRCIATDIFSTGVTFPDLRVICNAASGASGISSTQKPGRLAQVRPGKVCGYLVDFVWEANGYRPEDLEDRSFDRASNAWSWLVRDSEARFKTYEALGYDVKFVENYEEIKIV